MTLPYQYSYTEWKISSTSTVTYYYGFRVLNATDVKLYYKATSTSAEQEFIYGTHYYILDVGQDNGGRLTLTSTALALIQVNGDLKAVRKIEFTQPFDYIENSTFPAQTHENSIDRTMMCVQQNSRCAEQRLWVNEEFIDLNYTVVERAADGFLRWHSDGKGIYASFLTTTLFDVSAYYKSQLPLTTAAAARAGLSMASYPDDIPFKSKANTFSPNQTFLNDVICQHGDDPSLRVNGPIRANKIMPYVPANASIGTPGEKFPKAYFTNLWATTSCFGQFNAATIYIRKLYGQGGYTSLVSVNNITASSLASGPSAHFTAGHFTNLQIDTKAVIPDATLATHAMAYGQRNYSDFLGRISGLQFSYVDATNFYIGPGEVSVNRKMKKLPSQIQKTISGSLGKLYVWVQPGSESTLTGSMFHTSTTLPIYVNHLKAYYATSTSPYTTRCVGSLYLTGTDTLAPFFTVGDMFNFSNPKNFSLLTPSQETLTAGTFKMVTPTNYGPTLPGVRAHVILSVYASNATALAYIAAHIAHPSEYVCTSAIEIKERAVLYWETTITPQTQIIQMTTRTSCFAADDSRVRIYGVSRAAAKLYAYQVGWTWPIGLTRT